MCVLATKGVVLLSNELMPPQRWEAVLHSPAQPQPGKRWSRGSRTKLFLREESFVSHFSVSFIHDVHAVIATAR